MLGDQGSVQPARLRGHDHQLRPLGKFLRADRGDKRRTRPMTPCIGPYSPVAAIQAKSIANASIRPTAISVVEVRPATSAVVRAQDCQGTDESGRRRTAKLDGDGHEIWTLAAIRTGRLGSSAGLGRRKRLDTATV